MPPTHLAPASPPGGTCHALADLVLLLAGQHFDRWLGRNIWLYNATADSWTRVGAAPIYMKGHVCTIHEGRLYLTGGQTGTGAAGKDEDQSSPGNLLLHRSRARLDWSESTAGADAPRFPNHPQFLVPPCRCRQEPRVWSPHGPAVCFDAAAAAGGGAGGPDLRAPDAA